MIPIYLDAKSTVALSTAPNNSFSSRWEDAMFRQWDSILFENALVTDKFLTKQITKYLTIRSSARTSLFLSGLKQWRQIARIVLIFERKYLSSGIMNIFWAGLNEHLSFWTSTTDAYRFTWKKLALHIRYTKNIQSIFCVTN